MKYTVILNNEMYEVEIQRDGSVVLNGETYQVDFLELGDSLYSIIQGTRSEELAINENQGQYEILVGGRMFEAQVLDARAMLMLSRKGGLTLGSGEVTAPMPGLIVDVPVQVGDTVSAGETVIVLESMKMQNELKSPIDGVVTSVNCAPSQSVDKNALLVIITAEGAEE